MLVFIEATFLIATALRIKEVILYFCVTYDFSSYLEIHRN